MLLLLLQLLVVLLLLCCESMILKCYRLYGKSKIKKKKTPLHFICDASTRGLEMCKFDLSIYCDDVASAYLCHGSACTMCSHARV